ncbi:hypothetical protein [Chryseobacterium wangxinyae]|uniref:hypothetical protein n=1 Tax=Chryseobacterium sp. CY353 TaxID=2997334 RepID=UPI00226DCCAE|nr:hypothetical protein [Chryseobacterium sp. CY353]MCY0969373.1 hypothetical protein [Chryseobacterium sp. CY353]
MKNLRVSFSVLFLFLHSLVYSQIQAYVSAKTYKLESVDLKVENLVITLSKDGNITNFYSDEMGGEVKYYNEFGFQNAFKNGKLKSIGDLKIDYYDQWDKNLAKYERFKKIGDVNIEYWETSDQSKELKVKKIGNIEIDYYSYDLIDNSKFGQLKSIGNIPIDYGIKEIGNHSRIGKLIRFGNLSLDYWNDTIIDKENFGKLKSLKGNNKDVSVRLLQ